MRAARAALGLLGVVAIVVGLHDLWRLGWSNGVATARWLVSGVVLHDFVLTPVVLVVGVALIRAAPRWLRGPLISGLVVLGTVSVVAFPMIGRFGERPDNPTLLDRNYTVGWLAVAALVAIAVSVTATRNWRRAKALTVAAGRDQPH